MLQLRKKPTSDERYFGKRNRFTQNCTYEYYLIKHRINETAMFFVKLSAANFLQRVFNRKLE